MNKDFWERLDRLEELAEKATRPDWEIRVKNDNAYATNVDFHQANNLRYIAAANPAMIKEMIVEMRRLENENSKLKTVSEFVAKEASRLNKEADWLAIWCADACACRHGNCEGCCFNEQCICPLEDDEKLANKPNIWREAARKAMER